MINSTGKHAAPESAPHRDDATNPYWHRLMWMLTHGHRPAPRTHRYVTAVAVAE